MRFARLTLNLNKWPIAAIFVLACQPVLANTESVNALEDGISAFKAGRLHDARKLFLLAESEEIKSASLYYNLGVVNYRLGYYPSARSAFLSAANDDNLKSLAYYNLALVALKLKEYDDALHWLNQTVANNDNEQLVQLALNLSRKINKDALADTHTKTPDPMAQTDEIFKDHGKKRLATFIKTLYGYNDNVKQYQYIATLSDEETGDSYFGIQTAAQYLFASNFGILSSFAYTGYANQTNYNNSNLYISAHYAIFAGSWNYRVIAGFTKQQLDNSAFQHQNNTILELNRHIINGVNYQAYYRFNRINIEDQRYDYLQGNQHILANRLMFYSRYLTLNTEYRYEFNRRKDFVVNNETRTSFSPRSHFFRVDLESISLKTLSPSMFAEISLSNFPTADLIIDNDKAVRVFREDFMLKYGIRTNYRLSKNIALALEYQYNNNNSLITRYYYKRNIYQLSLGWNF